MKPKYIAVLSFFLFIGLALFSTQASAFEYDEHINFEPGELRIADIDVDVTASSSAGYNSNVNLNKYDEDSSLFWQSTMGINGTFEFLNAFTLTGAYDLTNIKYFAFSAPDYVNNALSINLDGKIADTTFVAFVGYTKDYARFTHDELSNHNVGTLETGVRHTWNDWLFNKISYKLAKSDYTKIRTRTQWGLVRGPKRKDDNNAVVHTIDAYIGDRTMVSATNELAHNDSNELFLDYYDYFTYGTNLEVSHLVLDNLMVSANAGYQRTAYERRSVSDTIGEAIDQHDNLYTCGAAAFYDVTPNVSLGTTFDYSDNDSNELMDEYESMVVTGGVYCSF